jgi:hypothetical protein
MSCTSRRHTRRPEEVRGRSVPRVCAHICRRHARRPEAERGRDDPRVRTVLFRYSTDRGSRRSWLAGMQSLPHLRGAHGYRRVMSTVGVWCTAAPCMHERRSQMRLPSTPRTANHVSSTGGPKGTPHRARTLSCVAVSWLSHVWLLSVPVFSQSPLH